MPRSRHDLFNYYNYETPVSDMDQDIFEENHPVRGSLDLTLHYVQRDEWGAKDRLGFHTCRHPLSMVVDHFTYSDRCHTLDQCKEQMRRLQEDHMSHGLTDIKYNMLIGGDGSIFEGRGWHYTASQSLKAIPGRLRKRFHIAFIGDYTDGIPHIMKLRRREIIDFMLYHEMINKGYFCTKTLRRPRSSRRISPVQTEPDTVDEKLLTPEELFKLKRNKIYAT